NLTVLGGTIYFAATTPAAGTELWRSDGTSAGTAMVKDIRPGPPDSGVTNLFNVNGTLVLAANDGTNGLELWRSAGTDAGTGVIVTPLAGLTTTEAGGNATFTVVLASVPAANVTIALTSSNTAEGVVTTPTLTFTPANALVPQTVTVHGINDNAADGDQDYTIVLAPAQSADPAYNGLDPADVDVVNADDDGGAGFLVTPTAGLTTTE